MSHAQKEESEELCPQFQGQDLGSLRMQTQHFPKQQLQGSAVTIIPSGGRRHRVFLNVSIFTYSTSLVRWWHLKDLTFFFTTHPPPTHLSPEAGRIEVRMKMWAAARAWDKNKPEQIFLSSPPPPPTHTPSPHCTPRNHVKYSGLPRHALQTNQEHHCTQWASPSTADSVWAFSRGHTWDTP